MAYILSEVDRYDHEKRPATITMYAIEPDDEITGLNIRSSKFIEERIFLDQKGGQCIYGWISESGKKNTRFKQEFEDGEEINLKEILGI